MRLLAIDPGSNKCGVAVFEDSILRNTVTLTTDRIDPYLKRLDIAFKLKAYVDFATTTVSEEPVLLGRNNNGMQRLLGMIEYITFMNYAGVHPMTLKKFMGSGSSDKLEMALAAGELVKTDNEKEIIADAIAREAFDETDAICVGLWYLDKTGEEQ